MSIKKFLTFYGAMSKHDFIGDYEKYDEDNAKKIYFEILFEISNAIKGEDVGMLEKLCKLITYINCIKDISILQQYYDASENKTRKTNFIILCCKYGKVNSLKFIFKKYTDILLNICNTGPRDEDDDGHNAFYYAIRSSKIDLLETLIEKWPSDHFKKNPEELDDLLAQSYEELKLKNVLLSEEMNIFIEIILIDLRFYDDNEHDVTETSSLKDITDRVEFLLEIIKKFVLEYSISNTIDEKKLHILKFIAQNIHILKRQLKSTYDKLPWEEMEFYIAMYVISRVRYRENNMIYKCVLRADSLLNYLEQFAKILGNIEIQSYGTKFGAWNKFPELERDIVIMGVSKDCPLFRNLYDDYREIMDHHALEKIYDYMDIATSSSPSDKYGQLVIARALQILGEYTETTLEWPKLSRITGRLLLLTLSKNIRSIVVDSDNISRSLTKLKELEEFEDVVFFSNIQNEMEMIKSEIVDLLFNSKIRVLRQLLTKLSHCQNMNEIIAHVEIFRDSNFEVMIRNMDIRESTNIITLVGELKKTIKTANESERIRFIRTQELLHVGFEDIKDFTTDYYKGLNLYTSLKRKLGVVNLKEDSMRLIKFEINTVLDAITMPILICNNLDLISYQIKKITDSATMRMQSQEDINAIEKLRHKIYFAFFNETGDVRWIQDAENSLYNIQKSIRRPERIGDHKMNCEDNDQIQLEQLGLLRNILEKNGLKIKSTTNISVFKENVNQRTALEMLVLEMIPILTRRSYLKEDLIFLDKSSPILIGKNLCDYMIHGNVLYDMLPFDPLNAVVINAIKLTEEDVMEHNGKTRMSLKNNVHEMKNKFKCETISIENQFDMFQFIMKGDFEKVFGCIKFGADINARNADQWTALHFAAKKSGVRVLEYILNQSISTNARDLSGKTALHIAACYGSENIVDFFLNRDRALLFCRDFDGKTALHMAAQNGFEKVVAVLLKYGVDCTVSDKYGQSALYCAIFSNGNIAKIMSEKMDNLNMLINTNGLTSLDTAATVGDCELVRYLLDRGADVQVRSDTGSTPLHMACLYGHVTVAQILISRGANVNAKLHSGYTPLHYAAEKGFDKVVELLIRKGAKVDVVSQTYNFSPIFYAAKYGHTRIVELLIKNRADMNIRTTEGTGPLHTAADRANIDVVRLLLKTHKIQANAKDSRGRTALHACSNMGHEDVVELLLKYGVDVNATDNSGLTSLYLASWKGQKKIIQILVKYGAKVNLREFFGFTPLLVACDNGHADIVNILIRSGASLDKGNIAGQGALHRAMRCGDIETVHVLVTNGAAVNSIDSTGMTPLNIAAKYGHKQIVHHLIQNGGNVNTKCEENLSPLSWAVLGNQKSLTNLLIENGANVCDTLLGIAVTNNNKDIVNILMKNYVKTNNQAQLLKQSWLHTAAYIGYRSVVQALLDNGAELDNLSKDVTPLYMAVTSNRSDVVELLVKRGANVNFQYTNIPVLHIAAGQGFLDIARILLENGARPSTLDKDNRTAIERAVMNGHVEIVKMLLEHRNVNAMICDGENWTLLHIAAQKGQLKCTEYLVKMGADVNASDCNGLKSIHVAARNGYKYIVQFYLKMDEDTVNDLDKKNWSLLHHSCATGQVKMVKYLIEKGLDVNASDIRGVRPLHLAARSGSKDTVDVLLNYGALYNSVSFSGQTPLEIARDYHIRTTLLSCNALFKHVKCNDHLKMKKCVSEGICIDVKNVENMSVLHYAAWKGYESITNILLQNGANPNIIGSGGNTPLHYASKFGHYEIVITLLSHNAIFDLKNSSEKAPVDLTNVEDIAKIMKILKNAFLDVKKRNVRVISDLKSIVNISTLKAIMKAYNSDNETLTDVAMQNDFPKMKELQEALLCDAFSDPLIADSLFLQEQYDEALSIYEQILETLGTINPSALEIRTKISSILLKKEMFKEALSMSEENVETLKKILGNNHERVLLSRAIVASILIKLERNKEALAMYEYIYAKLKKILDPYHESVIKIEGEMASLLKHLDRPEEVLNIKRLVYRKKLNSLGARHPSTVLALFDVAITLYEQDKNEESLKLYREVYEIRKKILGADHLDTLRTLYNMGGVYASQEKYDLSTKTYRKSYQLKKSALGPTHRDTLLSQLGLAVSQCEASNYVDAYQNFKEVLGPLTAILGSNDSIITDVQQYIKEIKEEFSKEGKKDSDFIDHMHANLFTAAQKNDIKTIELIVKTANVNQADSEGRTALHFAISNKHANAVEVLLKSGAVCTLGTKKGNTPLHIAVSRDDIKISKMLLCHVKETSINKLERFVNAKTNTGKNTALHVAVKNDSMEMVKILLQYGATYNAADHDGKTPLALSANKSITAFLELVQELFQNVNEEILAKLQNLDKDQLLAIANARNIEGNTLLIIAMTKKYHDVAQKLAQIFRMCNQ